MGVPQAPQYSPRVLVSTLLESRSTERTLSDAARQYQWPLHSPQFRVTLTGPFGTPNREDFLVPVSTRGSRRH
jgi:hypothetical protein